LYFARVCTSSRINIPVTRRNTKYAVLCTPLIKVNGAHGVTRPISSAILQLRCAGHSCAIDTAEDFFVRFDAMADDTAIAVWTSRRQRVDCALETIERVTLSAYDDFKGLVIIVLADFAFSHTQFVRARRGHWRCLIWRKRKFSAGGSTAAPLIHLASVR